MSEQTILTVEDEPAIRQLIARILETDGFQSEQVESADAALERLRERRYDLILLDLHMNTSKQSSDSTIKISTYTHMFL